jgi:hypothetical protein
MVRTEIKFAAPPLLPQQMEQERKKNDAGKISRIV